jgi:hypothetical protein
MQIASVPELHESAGLGQPRPPASQAHTEAAEWRTKKRFGWHVTRLSN